MAALGGQGTLKGLAPRNSQRKAGNAANYFLQRGKQMPFKPVSLANVRINYHDIEPLPFPLAKLKKMARIRDIPNMIDRMRGKIV